MMWCSCCHFRDMKAPKVTKIKNFDLKKFKSDFKWCKLEILFLKKLDLIEHKLCMDSQVSDTSSDESLISQ